MKRPALLASTVLLGAAALTAAAPLNKEAAYGSIPASKPPPQAAPFRAQPLQEFAAITERPLFARDRKKGSPAALASGPPSSAEAAPETKAVLFGVLDHARGKKALIAADSKAPAAWLSVDESVGGWTLVDIRKDAVDLESGDSIRKTISLYNFLGKVDAVASAMEESAPIADVGQASTIKN